MWMNPLLYFMAGCFGKYTKFICLRDCDDGQKNYTSNKLFEFKAGQLYGTSYTPMFPKQKNGIYVEAETFNPMTSGALMGYVSAEFLAQHFMVFDDYKNNFKELNKLFEEFIEA